MLPTFIIVGAAKCGTTSLWRYFKEHPEVCMARTKETFFFSRDIGAKEGADGMGQAATGRYSKGLAWYESLYDACGKEKVRGEVSTIYWPSLDSPDLIMQTIPGVKVIVILRDPVERLYSHYWEERKQGWDLPDFETMVEERHPRLERYIYVSAYHVHLQRYLDKFPRGRLSVFLFDDLRDHPQRFIREIYESVGVDSEFIPTNLGKKYNPLQFTRVLWLQRLLQNKYVMRLALTLPPWSYSAMGRLNQEIVKLNRATVPYPIMEQHLRHDLVTELKDAIDAVEDYLGRQLPAWRQV